jgi:hypothetical protein
MIFSGLASKPVATVFSGLVSKPMATVSDGLASKPDVTVSAGLTLKPTATVSSGLVSKPAVMVSGGLASKLVVTFFWFGPQNQWLLFDDFGLKITTMISQFMSQNQAGFGLSVTPQNQWSGSARDTRRDLAAYFM